jgi:NAD-dependent dihydropyrimidine dehydrogenase PreA subunit
MVYGPVINAETCIGCGKCIDACQMDVYKPAEKPGGIPIVCYPDECWYGGGCVLVCPTQPLSIKLVHPLNMRLALRKVK